MELKIKEGFEMRELSGQSVVIAVGKATETFNGMIRLNNSATELWKHLAAGSDKQSLMDYLLDKYEVDIQTAEDDVEQFLAKLKEAGILE